MNCAFSENTAYLDGATYTSESSLTLADCIFTANQAGPNGGGMDNWSSDPVLTNRTPTGNVAELGGGMLSSSVSANLVGCTFAEHSITGSGGCYYLSQIAAGQEADSPCVDTGSDAGINLGLADATTRSDEGLDGGTVDMGYHHPVIGRPLVMGDYDRDAEVDLFDFAALRNCFTGNGPPGVPACCRIFDFAPDEDVDVEDYAGFQAGLDGP